MVFRLRRLRRPPRCTATSKTFGATGIKDRVLEVGESAPDFDLGATDGRVLSLESLVTRGPVILTFYRGRW